MPIIKKHQSLVDFAIEHCGDAAAAIDIAVLNSIDPTADVAPGTVLTIPTITEPTALAIIKTLVKSNIHPSSATEQLELDESDWDVFYGLFD